MKTFIQILTGFLTLATVSAQDRLEWTPSNSIVSGAYLADIVRTEDGTLYAMCFTRDDKGQDHYHLSSMSATDNGYKLVWSPSGKYAKQGTQNRMQVHGNNVYFHAEDGSLMINSHGLDETVRNCNDTSFTTRIDVEADGTVYLTGGRRLAVPEFDSVRNTTRYGTMNVSIPTLQGCNDLIVSRENVLYGVPQTVAKNAAGRVLVAYHARREGNAVILRDLQQQAIDVQFVENQFAYDVELIHPEQDGWLFHLVQRKQGTKVGHWLVRTDLDLKPIVRKQITPPHTGVYAFSEVKQGKLLFLTEEDVLVFDVNSLALVANYSINQVVPEEHRALGARFVTASIENDRILIGTMDGYATMTLPVTSVLQSANRVLAKVYTGSEVVHVNVQADCHELQVHDVAGRSIAVVPSTSNGIASIPCSQLSSGVSIITPCNGEPTVVCVTK